MGRVKSRRKILSLGDGIFPRKGSKEGFSGDDDESGMGRKQGLEDGMVSDKLKRRPACT